VSENRGSSSRDHYGFAVVRSSAERERERAFE
jgi:hypothetical protein